MTTLTRPTAYPAGMPSNTGGEWRAGWRVALRLARRDVRRHLGRSALIVLMVAVPVLLLVGGNLWWSTQDLSAVERLPYQLGQTQASVVYQGSKFVPLPDNGGSTGVIGVDGAPTPIPGWSDTDPTAQVAALERLLGGRLYPVIDGMSRATVGTRGADAGVLGIDAAANPSAEGMVHLVSGRWPTTDSEAAVTPAGLAKGLPGSGALTLTAPGGTEREVSVVGVAEAYLADYGVRPADLVVRPGVLGAGGEGLNPPAYLLERDTPVSWDEVRRLADYGVSVTSRAVVLDPPDPSSLDLPPYVADQSAAQRFGQAIVAAVASIGLLLETTLLVGPAFAVSAARARRTLALAASNGATAGQLRRTVLAQALVLGALSALVGAAVGLLGALALIAWLRANRPDQMLGPLDVPALPIAIVVVCAILASVVAALIPARGLGRLDIVGVLRGQSVSPRARVRLPVAGLVLAGAGAVGVLSIAAMTPSTEQPLLVVLLPLALMLSAVALVVGALMLVPIILVGAARLGRSAPVALRMALRDAARQRGRATSTVAAILAGTSVLATVLIVLATTVSVGAATYIPRLPDGQAALYPSTLDGSAQSLTTTTRKATQAVNAAAPGLRVLPLSVVRSTDWGKPAPGQTTVPIVTALRKGCTPEQAMRDPLDPRQSASSDTIGRCASITSVPMEGSRSEILAADLEALVTLFELTDAERAVLAGGGILVDGDPAPTPDCTRVSQENGGEGWSCNGMVTAQVDIVDGRVTFARGTLDIETGVTTTAGTFTLAAAPIPDSRLNRAAQTWGGGQFGGMLTTTTAQALGLPALIESLSISDPRGPLTAADERAIRDAVDEGSLGYLYVERGFEALPWWVVAIGIGVVGLLILVATLVSTALSTAETQPMMGTFAAVGATRGTRRNLAAAQAWSIGLIGALLGTAVGIVPGIAIGRLVTTVAGYSATLSGAGSGQAPEVLPVTIPWLQLAIPIVLVPAVAALIAWLAIRRSPTVTRRLT